MQHVLGTQIPNIIKILVVVLKNMHANVHTASSICLHIMLIGHMIENYAWLKVM